MATQQNMERVYELLEQFDFHELSAQDKEYVLSNLTEADYIQMRKAIHATEQFFSHADEPSLASSLHESIINKIKAENVVIRLLKRPIQLYKVAAAVAVLLGIYSILTFHKPISYNTTLAFHDTVFIQKTDTVLTRMIDTVRIVKEKIVYRTIKQNSIFSDNLISKASNTYDCNKDICPNDIEKVQSLTNNNALSRDTFMAGFIVSIN
jgi:hypothetical protein